MIRRTALHSGFERLIGAAMVDRDLSSELLRDPCATALSFGLSTADADLVSDIRSPDMRHFATALVGRIYGIGAEHVVNSSAAAG